MLKCQAPRAEYHNLPPLDTRLHTKKLFLTFSRPYISFLSANPNQWKRERKKERKNRIPQGPRFQIPISSSGSLIVHLQSRPPKPSSESVGLFPKFSRVFGSDPLDPGNGRSRFAVVGCAGERWRGRPPRRRRRRRRQGRRRPLSVPEIRRMLRYVESAPAEERRRSEGRVSVFFFFFSLIAFIIIFFCICFFDWLMGVEGVVYLWFFKYLYWFVSIWWGRLNGSCFNWSGIWFADVSHFDALLGMFL